MADHLPFRQAPRPTPPQNNVPMVPFKDTVKDDEVWEYEYSATETETYYVTIDLTLQPDTKANRARKPKAAVPSTTLWPNPGLNSFVDPVTGRKPVEERHTSVVDTPVETVESPQADQEDANEAENPDDDEEAEFFDHTLVEAPLGNSLNQDVKLERYQQPVPTAVQVMDLHSEKPFVSYGGQLFVCKWTSNIGTELLFTRRDPQNPLPAIRSLPNNVDLLAASSIRLKSNLLQVKPKSPGNNRRRMSRSAPLIPVPKTAEEKENDQINFLESLKSIKKRRGETDEVTMILKMVENNKLHVNMRKGHQEEMARLCGVVERSEDVGEVEEAKRLIGKLEEEIKKIKAMPFKEQRPNKGLGRGNGRRGGGRGSRGGQGSRGGRGGAAGRKRGFEEMAEQTPDVGEDEDEEVDDGSLDPEIEDGDDDVDATGTGDLDDIDEVQDQNTPGIDTGDH